MSIYKDCDIRGIYGSEFDDDDAYRIGRAIGSIMAGKTMAVGGDVRLSTPDLKRRLIEGLLQSGARIFDIGTVPTPAFYFAIKQHGLDGGVMVTASHNPAKYNGFKMMLGPLPVRPDDIIRIRDLVASGRFTDQPGESTILDIADSYVDFIARHDRLDGVKIVVDAGNGAMGQAAPEALARLGATVTPLFCRFDGSFPNRDPNPANYSSMALLGEEVARHGADLGVGFDGDGDRVVFVDEKGRPVQSEFSLSLLIADYLPNRPGPVVYDLKSASVVKKTVLRHGGTPVMEKSGHAFIRRTFLQLDATVAGEISGHYFFHELGHDDGLYAAVKIAALVRRNGTLSSQVAALPTSVVTPDLRLRIPYREGDSLLAAAEQFGLESGAGISRLDGIRLEFPSGWVLLRKSVTEEAVTVRVEAESAEELAALETRLVAALPVLKPLFTK